MENFPEAQACEVEPGECPPRGMDPASFSDFDSGLRENPCSFLGAIMAGLNPSLPRPAFALASTAAGGPAQTQAAAIGTYGRVGP